MRPTFSIIFFTVMSGAGYGLWLLLGIGFFWLWNSCNFLPATAGAETRLMTCGFPGGVVIAFYLAFFLVVAGLLSSLGHLGKPQRAWRALSQWRSSWLSREGVFALLTFIPALGIVAHWILDASAVPGRVPYPGYLLRSDAPIGQTLGVFLAMGSAATVYCTANIYASLKPIRAWNNSLVAPTFLLLAIYSGLLIAWGIYSSTGWSFVSNGQHVELTHALIAGLIAFGGICTVIKLAYWKRIDHVGELSVCDATGLGSPGSVHSFEQPHTEENYLTHEMGFRLARKHSRKLRLICLFAGFGIPALFALLSLLDPSLDTLAAWFALFSGMSGIFVERWLFFAEARHTVMLYYGSRNA